MIPRTLLLPYAAFAIIAMIANLGAQRAVLSFGDSATFFGTALIAGTGLGLVVKYILDKRWIFQDRSTGLKAHGKTFSLYTGMGLITTLIFWSTETAFWAIWHTEAAREAGAVLGLALGYSLKYALDRRFVFASSPQGAPA